MLEGLKAIYHVKFVIQNPLLLVHEDLHSFLILNVQICLVIVEKLSAKVPELFLNLWLGKVPSAVNILEVVL